MEKLIFKETNLEETMNIVDEDKDNVFKDILKKLIAIKKNSDTYSDAINLLLLNASSTKELYVGAIALNGILKSKLVDLFTLAEGSNHIVDLNYEEENSVFGKLEIPEDKEFVQDVLNSILQNMRPEEKSMYGIMKNIQENPLELISSWSMFTLLLFDFSLSIERHENTNYEDD